MKRNFRVFPFDYSTGRQDPCVQPEKNQTWLTDNRGGVFCIIAQVRGGPLSAVTQPTKWGFPPSPPTLFFWMSQAGVFGLNKSRIFCLMLIVDGVFQSQAVNGTTLDAVVLFLNSQTDATHRGRKPGRSRRKITAVFNSWSDRPNRAMLHR